MSHNCHDWFDPAARIIQALGGTGVIAKELRCDPSTVARWRMPVSAGGCGGWIPPRHYGQLIALAGRLNVPLERAEFVAEPSVVRRAS